MALRADAPVFVPLSSSPDNAWTWAGCPATEDPYDEVSISAEELAELEAVDAWVERMAELDFEESECVIACALELAPPEAVQAIEQRAAQASNQQNNKSRKQ